jgi:hypothetical protein
MAHKPTELDESRFIRRYMHSSTQREGFKELWSEWIQRWGRVQAADALLIAMCEFESRFQDLRRLLEERRKAKRGRTNARAKQTSR